MVYRQTELSLQWQKTCREAQTEANASMYLQFKDQTTCDAAPPCDIAAFHMNTGWALVPCNKTAPLTAPNCAYCCNFSSVYNEPIGGQWPHGLKPAAGDNALGDGQVRSREVSPYDASWVNVMFYQDKLQMGAKLLDI